MDLMLIADMAVGLVIFAAVSVMGVVLCLRTPARDLIALYEDEE